LKEDKDHKKMVVYAKLKKVVFSKNGLIFSNMLKRVACKKFKMLKLEEKPEEKLREGSK